MCSSTTCCIADFVGKLQRSARRAAEPVVQTPADMAAAPQASLLQCEGKHSRRRVTHFSRRERDPLIPAVAPAERHQVDFLLQQASRGSSRLYVVTYKGLKPWSVCSWVAEERWKKGNVLNYTELWNGST